MINSRSLDELTPDTRDKAARFSDACAQAGIDILITSTYRDDESQDALYAQGRTKPGKKVTNVEGGHSFHNWRVAFDFVPIENGKCQWEDDDLWGRCGFIGEQCGLEWGGGWSGFVDKPHMQNTQGFKISDFVLGQAVLI